MTRARLRSASIVAVATITVGGIAIGVLPNYWIYLATAVLITAVNLLSLGVVEGRTGMISLCQLSFAGVGAWTVGWLNVAGVPGGLPLWILIGGLAAMPLGIAIGLPALRLRGINLAIVTLGFASAFDAILAANTFPGQTAELKDDTHFNAYGAYELARCMVDGIRDQVPALATHLRSEVGPFDPTKPDAPDSIAIPPSALKPVEKPAGN